MKIYNVELLTYDEQHLSYEVRYCVDKGTGVVRRSVATFANGELSRDTDKPDLLDKVKKLIKFKST